MTGQELKQKLISHPYVGVVSDEVIDIYDKLTEVQKAETTFHIDIVRSDEGDYYLDAAFSLPNTKTPEEALRYVEHCTINEVEYEAGLVIQYPILDGFGYNEHTLAHVVNFME